MKIQKPADLFILAVFSLVAIGMILTTAMFKNKTQKNVTGDYQNVLGENAQSLSTPTPAIDINRLAQQTIQDAQETVAQKVADVKKTIIESIEKEVTSLTQSQIEALKLQICKDWGVITVSPTEQP